jgi:hypothetical protein
MNRKLSYLVLLLVISIIAAFFQYQKTSLNNDYREYMKKIDDLEKNKISQYAKLREAEKENDLKKCDPLHSGEKNACFLSYSLRNYDIKACERISVELEAKNCVEMVSIHAYLKDEANIPKCSALSNASSSDNCYLAFISSWLTSKSPEKCDLPSLPTEYRTVCRDRFALASAITNSQEPDCERISDQNLKSGCKAAIKKQPSDKDNDGLSDREEKSYSTDFNAPDTDSDGLDDGLEVNSYHTNPRAKDTDADGLSDKNEIAMGTNPANVDTDGDGFTDSSEIAKGFNPCGDGSLPDKPILSAACMKLNK